MGLAFLGQAAVLFAVTNIDDLIILALYFGRAGRRRRAVATVVVGQYLGFAVILSLSVAAALGVGLLPEGAVPYLGLLPLLLGLRAAWVLWRERRRRRGPAEATKSAARIPREPGAWQVAGVTAANGGDNLGVYVPAFAAAGPGGAAAYVVVFLVGVAIWCVIGLFLTTRPVVARTFVRWGHVLMPVVLIGIGAVILVEGGAFGW